MVARSCNLNGAWEDGRDAALVVLRQLEYCVELSAFDDFDISGFESNVTMVRPRGDYIGIDAQFDDESEETRVTASNDDVESEKTPNVLEEELNSYRSVEP